MPTKRDNEAERAARLDALMEEYRTRSEQAVDIAKRALAAAKKATRVAKAELRQSDRSKRRSK